MTSASNAPSSFFLLLSNEVGVRLERKQGDSSSATTAEPSKPPSNIAPHICQLFDVPTLLFEIKWLGSEKVRVELTSKGEQFTQTARNLFLDNFAKVDLQADVAVHDADMGTLVIQNIRFDKKIQDPAPVMELAPLCLWVEPDKLSKTPAEKQRYRVIGDPEMTEKLNNEISQIQHDEKCVLRTVQLYKQTMTDDNNDASAQLQYSAKAVEALSKLDHTRQELTDIVTKNMQHVSFLECCALCDRVLAVVGGPKLQAVNADQKSQAKPVVVDRAKVEAKIHKLTEKLAQASGIKNKQKRKKIQREIKELQAKLDGTAPSLAEVESESAKAANASSSSASSSSAAAASSSSSAAASSTPAPETK